MPPPPPPTQASRSSWLPLFTRCRLEAANLPDSPQELSSPVEPTMQWFFFPFNPALRSGGGRCPFPLSPPLSHNLYTPFSSPESRPVPFSPCRSPFPLAQRSTLFSRAPLAVFYTVPSFRFCLRGISLFQPHLGDRFSGSSGRSPGTTAVLPSLGYQEDTLFSVTLIRGKGPFFSSQQKRHPLPRTKQTFLGALLSFPRPDWTRIPRALTFTGAPSF